MSGLVEFYEQHVSAEGEDFRFLALKELLQRRLRGGRVVDVGCGTGTMVRDLARGGTNASGLEPDPQLHALAERVRAESGLDYALWQASVADAPEEAFRGATDFLLLCVLEHLEDDRALLHALHGRMPEGARLHCLLPAVESLYGERDRAVGHFRRYSRTAAARLFATVPFRSVSVRWWNLLGVPAYFAFEKVLRRPVSEGFRLEERGSLGRALNAALLAWFRMVENPLPPPLGLSLLVTAER